MSAIPSTSIALPSNPFINENVNLTIGFDNTNLVDTGYGPFVLFYVDSSGADGDDGLTFNSASYLGAAVTTQTFTLTGSNLTESTFSVFGVEQTVTHPNNFGEGDTLVVMELPFGSFVADQPQADIDVILDGNINSDLNTPINLQTQGGFVFGNTPEEETDGSDDPIYEDISGDTPDTITPQLVSLTKNYLGPEDETATGPNFLRQFELVVDIAEGQTIDNLDITDILPDNMQFVDVVSIVDSTGSPLTASNISSPDDDSLSGIIGSTDVDENTGTTDSTPTPGGTLTRRISSITGTSSEEDIVLTYEFFIPRLDSSSSIIIDADTGDDVISTNESQIGDNNDTDSNNTWNPVDSRDPVDGSDDLVEIYIPATATNPSFPTHDLEDQSIAIQKSVTNITDSENSPGDILEYTLDFQVSDYFAFENVNIVDTFSDGQRYFSDATRKPTLVFFNEHGSSVSGLEFTTTNYNPIGSTGSGIVSDSDLLIIDETDIGNDTNSGTSGETDLTFDVSGLLANASGQDNQLVGGGVPSGGFGVNPLNNNPPLPNGATEGQIVFYTQIQQEYSDTFASGDASVDIGDRLDNTAIIDGDVLDVETLSTTVDNETDDTSAAITIEEGNLYKSIYAINGEIFSGADTDTNLSDGLTGYASGVNISPGDRVTYRLTYELPTTDVEDLTLTDYFPLPIYDAETEFASTTFDSTVSSTVPIAGATKYGPLDTFSTRQDASSNSPNLTFSVSNDGGNSLTYSYADFDDDDNQSSIVDILVTVTAEDEPAADGLLYTNQVRQTNNTTFNEDSFLDAIIQVTLDQPEVVDITKGVVAYSSDNTDIAFSSTLPSDVTFSTGGGTSFTGTVSSTDLASTPLTSNLTGGLEAGDIVTFALVVENQGNSRKGAFDVTVQDDLPTGFVIPNSGLNLNVTDGTGTTITYTGLDDNDASGDDLFGTGIELDDPGSTSASGSGVTENTDAGSLDPYDADSGENLAIITFDLEVDDDAPYLNSDDSRNTPEEITNTATLVSYANIEGGEDFSGSTDTATVEIDLPETTKSIVATSEAHTSEDGDGTTNDVAGRRRLAIGEIIRYRLVATIPEGTANNFQLRDRLPGGLLFLDDGTATAAFVSDDSPITSVDTTTNYTNPLTIGLGSPGTFDGALWMSGTDATNIMPTFALPDANVGRNRNIGNNSSGSADNDNYYSGTDPYFKFGDITNLDRDEDDEYVIVEFNALVTNDYQGNSSGGNITTNDFNENRSNSFQVNVGTGSNFNTSDELVRSDSIYARIVEPVLNLTKQVGSDVNSLGTDTFLADSGNTVYFSLDFSNATNVNQNASAFDVELTDTVPDGLTLTGIDSIVWDDGDGSGTESSITSGGSFTAGDMTITPTFDTGTGVISVTVDKLPTSADISVIYTATADSNVNPDELITNTANVIYSSLPGDDSDGTNNSSPGTSKSNTTDNPTGSDVNNTTSGTTLSERNSDSATNSANDYSDSSSASVQIEPLDPVKDLISTSESHTSNNDVAIGEIVRYQLAVTIPEGETDGFTITDNLPDGLVYLDDGTVNIAFIADETGISSSNTDINNLTDLNLTGTAITSPDTDADLDLVSGAINDAGADGNFSSGEDITFTLGDLTNADRDADNEYVVIEFNALVENIANNTDGGTNDPLSNQFTVGGTSAELQTSNAVNVDIVEPVINDVAKAVDSPTADAGDQISYTVTFSNTGTASTFDVNVTDTLPNELENPSITSVKVNGTTRTFSGGFTNNVLDIIIDGEITNTDSVEIIYAANVVSTVAPETSFSSDVTVEYSSLEDTGTASNDTGSDNTAATSGDTDSDRNGNGTIPNTYTDSNDAPVTVTIDSLEAEKTLFSTSDTSTNGTNVVIDEVLRYRLQVEIPEGVSENFKITDELPDGLTYQGNTEIAFVSTNTGLLSGVYSDNLNIGILPQTTSTLNNLTTVSLNSSAIADSGGDSSFASGEDIIFNLGNITNADSDVDSEYVVIEFDAIVNGVENNGSLSNAFRVTSAIDDSIVDTSEAVVVNINIDYGDAPDSGSATPSQGDYLTLQSSNGASHGIRTGVTIGGTIDADNGTLQNSAASADGADEDGIDSFNLLQTGDESYTISIDVTNDTGTGQAATLVGWIDFNRNGEFESEEAVSTTVGDTSGIQNIELKWDNNDGAFPDIPNDITPGDTYARFRLSTDSELDANLSTGIVDDGEVEDYAITIYNTVTGNSYSDSITEDNGVPDIITGGEGQDTITGGTGEDIFVYTKTSDGVDIIEDFDDGTDLIDFSAIVAGELGSIDFTGTDPIAKGYVDIVSFGDHTMIQVDFDNTDTFPKDVLLLDNITSSNITVADFIF